MNLTEQQYVLLSHWGFAELQDNHFPSWTWLSNNQTLQSSTIEALRKEQNGTRCEYAFFQNLCEPKFPFVETNIFFRNWERL